uniref:Putative signaling protein ric-8/synembryn regulates neurotransmitter secretion n=2 Tax=Ornithodoros turicata TaxID=34597 RepID=A0A2R5LMH2_9ACAR
MRMLFLLTALCADIRPRLRTEQHGVTYLREALDLVLKGSEERGGRQPPSRGRLSRRGRAAPQPPIAAPEGGNPQDLGGSLGSVGPVPRLDDDEALLAAEILKVLFNLTVSVDKTNVDEEDEVHFQRLVGILHDLLLCDIDDLEKKDEVCGQVVHVLSNMPRSTYEELLSPGHGDGNEGLEYEGFNIEAVNALLDYLEKRLDTSSLKNQSQSLSPILHCLTECARGNAIVRKYLRSKILPPLKDVKNRPEEGSELRNKLVRLMTSPNTDVKNLVADLLFVLCKEKVGRLIKYTGYGNAAGLLANRGLMLGGRGKQGSYSSDSEDSDTEEYARYKDKINPVLGCYEEPHPNPLEGMTEEQKEYEAMQLVNMMDKLTRGGVLKPMRVGKDGRPHPVDHILELQEGLQDRDLTESESD